MKKTDYHVAAIALGLALALPVQADTIASNAAANYGGGRADFRAVPKYVAVSYSLRQRLAGFEGAATIAIRYSNGSVREVSILRSSGRALLDAAILRDVTNRYWVKKGRSGLATQPVDLTFPSAGDPVQTAKKLDSEWILRVGPDAESPRR
ncbi:MAG TPA: hypothetical protein VIT91_01370 [Chthoniobacterales bacterium]